MFASSLKINNICAIIDNNGFQQTGTNNQILDIGDLTAKWKSFGWETLVIDGHNVTQILNSLKTKSDKPKVIIAKTIKGKGFSFSENNNEWHHKIMTKQNYMNALKELKHNEN